MRQPGSSPIDHRPLRLLASACLVATLAAIRLRADPPPPRDEPPHAARLRSARVTILSTMLADTRGLGEWGFAALVEADGRRLLFDTGARPETVRPTPASWASTCPGSPMSS